MTSKIANQYSGIVPDDDATESSSSVPELGPTGRHGNAGSGPATNFSYAISRRRKLTMLVIPVVILGLFFFWLGFSTVKSSKETNDLIATGDAFQKDVYYPLTGKGTIGYTTFLAILLYKRENSDAMFGHIPHVWVGSKEPFLLVDQITKGVGELK